LRVKPRSMSLTSQRYSAVPSRAAFSWANLQPTSVSSTLQNSLLKFHYVMVVN
jgi:hypothetical protein